MTELSKLYEDIENQNIKLFIHNIKFTEAATIEMGGQYGIFLDLSCFCSLGNYKEILAHEIGHCATGCTHKVSSPYDLVQKHEYKANRWAIERYIPFDNLSSAVQQGYTEVWQLAEYFGFPEGFIRRVIDHYCIAKGKRIEGGN